TGSGFRCLENVHAVNEMCNALWSGLSDKLLDANGSGLSGITQPQNGLPSYVSRMVAEASGAVRQQAVNAAIGILANARQIEGLYLQAMQQIATVLADAIGKLRGTER